MYKQIKDLLLVNGSNAQAFAKNTFWLFISEVGGRFLKFILILYVARILGAENWGIFSYSLSVVSLFFIFSDLGLNTLATREIAKNSEEQERYLSTAFFLRLGLLVPVSGIVLLVVPQITHIAGASEVLWIVTLLLAIDSLKDLLISVHRGLKEMQKEALIKVSGGILTFGLGLWVLMFAPSVKNLAYAYLWGSIAGFLLTVYTLKGHLLGLLGNFSKKLIPPILEAGWPLFIFGVIGVIINYTDIVMLGWWRTPAEVGLYSVAQRLMQFLLVIPGLIAVSMFPIFSKLFAERSPALRSTLEKTLALVFSISLPITLGGIIVSNQLIPAIFGAEYLSAAPIFQIFLIVVSIMFPMLVINNYIFVLNEQKQYIRYMIGGAFLNIILNFFLIQKLGIYGAAWSTAIATLLMELAMWRKAKSISPFYILPHIKKIILATLIMGAFTWAGKNLGLPLSLNLLVSAMVFFGSLWALREPLLQDLR